MILGQLLTERKSKDLGRRGMLVRESQEITCSLVSEPVKVGRLAKFAQEPTCSQSSEPGNPGRLMMPGQPIISSVRITLFCACGKLANPEQLCTLNFVREHGNGGTCVSPWQLLISKSIKKLGSVGRFLSP